MSKLEPLTAARYLGPDELKKPYLVNDCIASLAAGLGFRACEKELELIENRISAYVVHCPDGNGSVCVKMYARSS